MERAGCAWAAGVCSVAPPCADTEVLAGILAGAARAARGGAACRAHAHEGGACPFRDAVVTRAGASTLLVDPARCTRCPLLPDGGVLLSPPAPAGVIPGAGVVVDGGRLMGATAVFVAVAAAPARAAGAGEGAPGARRVAWDAFLLLFHWALFVAHWASLLVGRWWDRRADARRSEAVAAAGDVPPAAADDHGAADSPGTTLRFSGFVADAGPRHAEDASVEEEGSIGDSAAAPDGRRRGSGERRRGEEEMHTAAPLEPQPARRRSSGEPRPDHCAAKEAAQGDVAEVLLSRRPGDGTSWGLELAPTAGGAALTG
eukprot:gene18335-26481_t